MDKTKQLTFQVHFKGSDKELIELKQNIEKFLQMQRAELFNYKERLLTIGELRSLGVYDDEKR